MIVHLRETGPMGRLSGAALVAAVLLSVGACTDFSLGSAERASGKIAEVETAPTTLHGAAAPQERMPPPFEPADAGAPPMPRGKPESLLLTVAEGDSVHRIARQHGVEPSAIISLNGLSEPYWLLVGQRLRIPLETDSVARHREPPSEQSWRAGRNGAGVATTEIAAPAHTVQVTAAEPLTPTREERVTDIEAAAPVPEVHVAAVETWTPSRSTRVTEIQTSAPVREPSAASAAVDPGPVEVREKPAPMPPAAPGNRAARAESSPSALSTSARQADVNGVPLPPTRNTFLWPTEGRVISRFGTKPGGTHNDGINIAVPVGTAVRAAQNGVVAYAGNELRGYGNLVLIRHDGGWMTAYAHNDSLLVGKGDVVERGQVISRSGKSGRVSRPQAHFEIRRDGEPQDPLRLLTRK